MQTSRIASFIPFGVPGLFDEFMQNLDVAAFGNRRMRVQDHRMTRLDTSISAAGSPVSNRTNMELSIP